MLTLILGRGKSGKTKKLLEAVRDCPAAFMASRILIVPEQLSHQTERQLSALCGDQISYTAEVLSFTRLCSRVCAVSGGGAVNVLDQCGRILSARLALQSIQTQMKVFAAAAMKTDFLQSIVGMIDEFKSYQVTAEMLLDASKRSEGQLAQKLLELSLMLSSYQAVIARGTMDPRDRLTLLKQQLLEGDYAKGRYFFVDGFTDFSAQELGVLEALLKRGAHLTVTLPWDQASPDAEIFRPGWDTMARLLRMAGSAGISVETIHVEEKRNLPAVLTYLERNLFSHQAAAFMGEVNAVQLREAKDRLEECRACAAALRRCAMQGIRWRDMHVAASDASVYGTVMEAVCREYGVPLFTGIRRPVTAHPAVAFVLCALEAAAEGMDTETVIAYLRTGYSGVSADQCDALENYAFTWSIRGQRWQNAWTEHPEGYDGRFTEDTARELEALNGLREQAVGPLLCLSANLKSAGNTMGQLAALYQFLEDTDLYAHISREIQEQTDAGDLEYAQETAQLWNILMECMEQIAAVLGATAQNSGEMLKLLRIALSQYSLGTIPAVLDAVSFGGIDSVRGQAPKVVYILGASEGTFPAPPAGGSLLSEFERELLIREMEMELAPARETVMERQLLQIYSTLSAPSERLFISWSADDQGRTQPSYLVRRLQYLLPALPVNMESIEMETALTLESLTELYLSAEEYGKRGLMESLRRTAGQVPELEDAVIKAKASVLERDLQISRELSARLFGAPVVLTASRLDELGNCPLSFFLNYGIKARVRKEAAFDAAEFGTFMHYILEKTVSDVIESGETLPLSEAESEKLVDRYMAPYITERLRSADDLSQRQSYLYYRNCREASLLLGEITRELSVSSFRPCAYELKFGDGKELGSLTVHSTLGQGRLDGTVDRVDLWQSPDGCFFRIVDYKSGTKKFDYTDLQGGVGMQLFLYMFALCRRGIPGIAGPVRAAGAMYLPAKRSIVSVDEPLSPEEAERERRSKIRRSGLLLDREDVLEAMEQEPGSVYIPAKRKKDGSGDYVIPQERMELLEDFIERRMRNAVDRIYSGDFLPEPFYRGQSHDPCRWCSYGDVCQKDPSFRRKYYHKSVKPQEFWEYAGGEENG